MPADRSRPDRPVGRDRKRPNPLPPLSLTTRVLLHLLGWLLLLVGAAGLALPGIQGILTLVLGASILSLASNTVHGWLRTLFRRWPRGWKRIERFRRKLHEKLSPRRDGSE